MTAIFVGLIMLPTPPASAEGFDKVVFSTDGDGWDITFHPTNQNYAFFVHHRGTTFGCLYRLDPDGNGPIEQGDGCFGTDGNGDSVYLLDLGGNRTNGLKSSAWVTSDGNTVYIPQNKSNNSTIAKVDISDPDPTQWTVGTSVNFASPMQEHSNSIMVNNVLWATSSAALLKYDTTTQATSFKLKSLWQYAPVYHADGRIWSVSNTYSLVCFDLSTDQFCNHESFTDGVGAALGTSLGAPPDHVVEYRNQDGSFGGFCSNVSCVNANGAIDTNMVNGAVFDSGDYHNRFGLFHVTDQHLVIRHQPLETPQTYTCWDYTTRAECAGSKFTPSTTSNAGKVYNVIQDPWNANCLWTNADDKIIGAWDIAHTGGFATGGECDLTIVSTATTVTLAYDAQGGSGAPGDQIGNAASNVTVSTTEPTRDGYTFAGWDTAADGSGTDYTGGDSYTLPNSGTDTLYAQWTPDVTLTYDPLDGTGEPDDQTGNAASNVTVSTTEPTRDGYTFAGWDTAADGSGTDYTGGDSYTLPNSGTDTLYAQWTPDVTLTYDPLDGTGEPDDQTGPPLSDVTVSSTEPTRDGYTFTGWDTAADGSGADYSGGATYTLPNSGTDTLYAQWTPVPVTSVTLTYDPQGGSDEPGDQTGDAASDVTVSSTVPTRDGYTFTGWDTAADGSGIDYSGGATYTLPNSGTDTLYAQWQINTVTLAYDPQGGTGQPVDQTGDAASDVTVSTTEPTRDGYTFAGWDTVADGSGTDYSGGDSYTLPNSGTDTLYAQWTPDVTLTYDPQDGTGEPDDQTGPPLSDVTVSSTVPTRDGYTFLGWDTVADGSGTDYSGGDSYTLPNSGTDTLYAQWTPDVTLTYDPLDGTGEPDDQTGPPLSDVTVSSTEPTRDGYTFAGWDTVADGSGTDYSGGATYTLPSSGTDTLYAQWTPDVTLTYDPLDGTGEPDDQTGPPLSDVTVSSTEPTRDGYTFLGWDVAADGSGTDYAGGDPYTLPNNGTDTLYAQWQINTVTLAYDPQGGTGQPGDQTGDAASDVTVSSTVPTRDGYTFLGWGAAADGSGTDYSGGATYRLPNSGTDILYAQWQINTVTLAYDPQGGSGEPDDQTGDAASDVMVSTTEPTRDGYTFTGWDTAANGSGTDYAGGDPYTLPNNGTDTLYAQWQINTVTLAYDPQGGSGKPVDQTGDAASDVTVSITEPTRDGYTFLGWDTAANGSGTDYAGGDPYTLPNNGTDTLYAQWQFNTVTLVLTGDPESDVTVSATEPTRDGYTFTGWNTALDGSGTSYSDGDTVTLPNNGTDTLYAQWKINTVTLAFDPQGGSGEPGDQTGDAASDVTVSSTVPTRDGYTFTGWNTAADGSGMDCVGGDTVTLPNSDTIMLYAQWTPVVTTTGAEPAIPVPLLPALLLLLTSLLLAAVGIKRFV